MQEKNGHHHTQFGETDRGLTWASLEIQRNALKRQQRKKENPIRMLNNKNKTSLILGVKWYFIEAQVWVWVWVWGSGAA